MKLILKPNDYKHDFSKSTYNNEYFKHKELGYQLREEHDEDREINLYYLLENGLSVYLGYSKQDGILLNEIGYRNKF